MKQIHQKELEDKDEELEDVRQSCQRRVGRRQVGGQCWVLPRAPPVHSAEEEPFPGVLPPWGAAGRASPAFPPPARHEPRRSPWVRNQGLGQA